jgi:hypothetical protein
MSNLDRDKAQAAILEWEATEPMPIDALLDRLEECVQPDSVEGRDWIGNPDGTLVYWQAEAEDARAKLARIAALFSDDVWWHTSDQKIRRDVLAILEGGAA